MATFGFPGENREEEEARDTFYPDLDPKGEESEAHARSYNR